MTEQSDTFGRWLRRRRRALDMTQAELADCSACSIVTIRKFESDERRPSRALAEMLADCLQIPAEERERFVGFARQREDSGGAGGPGGGQAEALSPVPAAARVPQAAGAAAVGLPPAPPLPLSPAPQRPRSPAPPLIALPAPLTGLVGREGDVAAVVALLQEPGARVVTLTGPGGTGKTRLAIAAGRCLADDLPAAFADGVVFVDLSSVQDAALVVPIIGQALGAQDTAGHGPLATLISHVGARRLLLILDNFEQVVDAADELLPLLSAAGGLKLLVTSRSLLRLYGEFEVPVAPLPLPPPGASEPAELLAAPAVALFVARARAARPGFALDAGNATAVVALCARLDGLPLAIELAAARVRLASPAALLAQLSSALDLAAQLRQVSERQRTLRGAIDWSYRLLAPDEQRLFDRLGVFSGEFGLSAVAAVCGDGPAEMLPAPEAVALDLLDRLNALVDNSMIKAGEAAEGEPRFRLLVVLREYAVEQLARRDEDETMAARHQAHYLALAEHAAPLLEKKEQAAWLGRLSLELDNLRAALGHGLTQPAAAVPALRLAAALRSFWRFRGLFSEGRGWLARLIDAAPAGTPPVVLADALSTAGMLARYQDDHEAALALLHRSLDLYRQLDPTADRRGLAITLRNVAAIYYWREELERVEQYSLDILAIEREANNLPAVATMLGNLSSVYKLMGRFDLTRRYQQEALALHRQVSGTAAIVSALNGMALLEFHEGKLDEAQRLYGEALGMARAIGDPYHQAMLLANLAESDMVQGRLDEAVAYLTEALELAREGGFSRVEMSAIFNLGLLRLLAGGRPAEAWPEMRRALVYWTESGIRVMVDVSLYPIALLLSRAGHDAAAVGLVSYVDSRSRNPVRAPDFAMMLAEIEPRARQRLGAAGYAAAAAEGRALSMEEATALALREGDRT